MAKGASAEKAHRQSLRRRDRNRHRIRTVRTLVRRAREAVTSGTDERAEEVKRAMVALDRAAARGTLHPKNAARRKSRLMRLLNKTMSS